jgi:putative ABC transport system permease protein
VAGATKRQLVQQFLGEALLLTGLALVVAVFLAELGMPHFTALIGRRLTIDFERNVWLWLGPIAIGLFVGLLSGSYPAFFLSTFQPLDTLKAHLKTGSAGATLRKALVVVQFTLTITLMIGTGVVYDQLNFMQHKRLGFEKDQVLVAPIRDQNLRQNPEPLKSRLRQYPGILHVGAAALLPGGPVGKTRFRAEAGSNKGTMSMLWVDQDFISALGMELIAGRDFSKNFATDATDAVILNEEAIKQLGWIVPAEAIGKSFELVGSKKGTIIGVVRDFHFTSLHRQIEPVVLHIWPWLNYVLVRVDAAHLPGILGDLEDIWQEFDPNHPFTFTFLDDNFDRFYQSEKRLGQVSSYFSLLAIFVACSGLFGLASFTAEQRTKEIGIRKVLGASVARIVLLLSQDFLKLVLAAIVVALPIAYFAMNRWLLNFAYRIDLQWWVFALAGGLALLIAMLTVCTQAIKAALANPVESLRYE